MNAQEPAMTSKRTKRFWLRRAVRRLCRSEDGASAIEFAFLALPYFLVVFAIIETFLAFTAEQVVSNAVDTMARRLRTGQITFNMNRSTDMNTAAQFRSALCDELTVLITCSATERTAPDRLYVDLRSFSTFAAMAQEGVSVVSHYNPGGPGSLNMLRVYYRWHVLTDLVRPYITNYQASGGMPREFLMIATAAFQNEGYP